MINHDIVIGRDGYFYILSYDGGHWLIMKVTGIRAVASERSSFWGEK
jgi:hypothetical protein